MTNPTILVLPQSDTEARAAIADAVAERYSVVYLTDIADADRAAMLSSATAVLSLQVKAELADGEAQLLTNAKLIQLITAGVDHIPLDMLPDKVPVASNGGGYAEPMAEHALAMTLAALKRLFTEHNKITAGDFDQFRPNRMLAGSTCGILGLGGIGVATARLLSSLGATVQGINRSGTCSEALDWVGSDAELPRLLQNADILILSLPLTPDTNGLLAASELASMKPDAILVNLARGEIVDEAALFNHLQKHPDFTACIDAWWIEPVRHGEFRQDYPFTGLANVIASPHNSASVKGWRPVALQRAVGNILRVLEGNAPLHLVKPADRMQ